MEKGRETEDGTKGREGEKKRASENTIAGALYIPFHTGAREE